VSSALPVHRWQLLCFLVAVAAGLIGIDARATYGARVSADEPQYLLTAISLYEDLDLDISDELAEERFLPFHEIQLNQQTLDLNGQGQRISPHDPLLPLILAVPMGLWGWAGAKATLAVLTGLTALATFTVATRRFGITPAVAGMTVIAFFVGAPFAAYGAQVYPAIPAALCVVVGVGAATGDVSTRKAILALVAIVALPWLSVKYVPLSAVLAIGMLWQHWCGGAWRAVTSRVVILAVAGLVYAIVHQRVWGGWTVYASGDHFVGGEFEVVGTNANYVARTNRLLGLLVDRYFGIAAWAPAFLLTPAGLTALVRFRRGPASDALLVVATVAIGWAVATWVALTMHGWWWAGRQIVPVLPLVVVSVGALIDRFRVLVWPTVALGVVGFVNWTWIAIEASSGRRALIVDHEETANPLFQTWKHVLPDHRIDGLGDQVLTIVWAVALAGTVLSVYRGGHVDDRST